MRTFASFASPAAALPRPVVLTALETPRGPGGAVVLAIAVLALGTLVLKSAGPVAASGRTLPPLLARAVDALPPALLAALVATGTVGVAGGLAVDARAAGMAVAALAVWRRAPFPLVVLGAAVTTALVRLAT